jgi:hypothetical protein
MLRVVMLNVVMLSVTAPTNNLLSLGRKKMEFGNNRTLETGRESKSS